MAVSPASGKFCTLDVKERMTTPPTYLTESELISRMEKHGIGTDASISTHIENIQKRNYVELIPGRKLKPSRLGLVLAQGECEWTVFPYAMMLAKYFAYITFHLISFPRLSSD